jgi:hypothetical protein
MDAIQRPIVVPQGEVAMHRAAGWKVLRKGAPLAAGAQDRHQAIDHVPHGDRALAAAPLRRRDQRFHKRPFLVGQVARIAKMAAVIAMAVLVRPHRRHPVHRVTAIESQPIPMIQDVFGQTLRGLVQALSVMHAPRKCHCRKTLELARIDAQTFAPPENQDSRDIQPRDSGGGRFMLKSSVTSCRSSADEMVTFSHFPSGYVRDSS